MSVTPTDRRARLADWRSLARDALAHAGDAALTPTGGFGLRVEHAGLWPWPDAGMRRCKALVQVAKHFCEVAAEERAALAPALDRLAHAVLDGVGSVEAAADEAARPARRLPYRED